MYTLSLLGSEIYIRRKFLGISQTKLAKLSGVSRATIEALENGRAKEIGFLRVSKVLSAIGLEFRLRDIDPQ